MDTELKTPQPSVVVIFADGMQATKPLTEILDELLSEANRLAEHGRTEMKARLLERMVEGELTLHALETRKSIETIAIQPGIEAVAHTLVSDGTTINAIANATCLLLNELGRRANEVQPIEIRTVRISIEHFVNRMRARLPHLLDATYGVN